METVIIQEETKVYKYDLINPKARYAFYLNEVAEHKKSEYINNEIVIHSPAKKKHVDVSLNLVSIIRAYVVKYDLGFVGQEKILTEMKKTNNSYEPDICFFRKEKTLNFKDNTDRFPPPDWAIEIISKTSQDRDRKTKYWDYAKNGVEEYWLINTNEEIIEQYYLDNGVYILIQEYCNGQTVASITLPQLTIPLEAIFDAVETYNFHFGKYEKTIIENEEIIKTKNEILVEKEDVIKQQKEIIKQKNKKLKEKDKILKEKDDKLKENQEILKEKDDKLKEKDDKLKENQEILKEKDDKLKENQEILKEKDDKLKENQEILKEKESLIAELMKKLDTK